MYLEYAYRILNAKIAYFSAQTRPFAIEAAADLYARAPASWRISGKEYDDGWVFILEPKTLATFTPRFHLFADKLASFYEPSRHELFKGSDAAVLITPHDQAAEVLTQARASLETNGLNVPIVMHITSEAVPHLPDVPVERSGMDAFRRVADVLVTQHFAHDAPELAAQEFARWPSLPLKC